MFSSLEKNEIEIPSRENVRKETSSYKSTLPVSSDSNRIILGKKGNCIQITLQRTLRIPDDGKVYPLPPSLGSFPIHKVDDYKDKVPKNWLKHGGLFFPMYQREAMWMNFSLDRSGDNDFYYPKALKIGVGKTCAITGEKWRNDIGKVKNERNKQDYVVIPTQPWLDGINSGKGYIRQFVAMPLGSGYTVEEQVKDDNDDDEEEEEESGGIQFIFFESKKKIPIDKRKKRKKKKMKKKAEKKCSEMGLAAGGKMKQEIARDPFGLENWDLSQTGRIFVHIVHSKEYERITGEQPPPCPIRADTYNSHGFPWYDIYNEEYGVEESQILANKVKSLNQIDQEKGMMTKNHTEKSIQIKYVHFI